jgi:pimeloyl-ACP methyl ester carboxylesterase
MNKHRLIILFAAIVIVSSISMGCSTATTIEPEIQPSDTPIPPTVTQEPPTSTQIPNTETPTPLPPTETPFPPTSTNTPVPPSPTPEATEEPIARYTPIYETIPCRFKKPSGFEIECGVLTVPEDRSKPDGNQVELHVAIYKSRSDNPLPDPVFYLTGGGGGNELERGDRYLDDGNDAILDQRDFIMFNQRGTKFTNPYLQCEGLSRFYFDLAFDDVTLAEAVAREVAFIQNCRDQFIEQGFDLDMYNTARNADDLNDLRMALGYDQINIYGTSYGSRYVLYALRMYGQHIRSAIIDSVFPPQTRFFSQDPVNVFNSFKSIFDQCEADSYCSQQYPDIEQKFYEVIDQLDANPRTITVSGTDQLLSYDGNDFLSAIYYYPYLGQAGSVPKAISRASQGNYSYIDPYIPYAKGLGGTDTIAVGVQNSILCREEAPFDSYERLQAGLSQMPPQFAQAYDTTYWFDLCEVWDVEPADPTEKDAVVSDIPTLILTGEFDPITPPHWAQLAAETLTISYYYEFPDHGHGIMRSDRCGFEIGFQFLNDPYAEPDATCLDDISGIEFE